VGKTLSTSGSDCRKIIIVPVVRTKEKYPYLTGEHYRKMMINAGLTIYM